MEAVTSHQPALHDIDHVLSLHALKWAWLRVRENKGAAGGDGMSLKRYERMLEANLLELADQVRNGTYQPSVVRTVTIRGPRRSRRIAILSVRDRVLQRAVLELIDGYCDRQFLTCSYGYRPGRSVHDAVNHILQAQDRGLRTVVDADIQRCFETLDHEILRARFDLMLPGLHDTVRNLVHNWIAMRPGRIPMPKQGHPHGVLQGAPISPLLCNIYLHLFDQRIHAHGFELVRYADDFVILCPDMDAAEYCLETVRLELTRLLLKLNDAKTSITTFANGLDFLGVHFTDGECSYAIANKRIVVRDTTPPWFHYHPEGYEH